MKNSIQGDTALCKCCCFGRKYKRVALDFRQAFEELPIADRIHYYRKYIDTSLTLAKKKTRFPETTNNLEELENRENREQVKVRYRLCGGKKWRTIMLTLDSEAKVLESIDFKVDLHWAFVSRSGDGPTKVDTVHVLPWNQ